MKRTFAIGLAIAALMLASLACETGQVLTPEEATQVAVETRVAEVASAGQAIEAELGPGDTVELQGNSLLVPLFEEPGSTDAVTQVARGDTGTVLEAVEFQAEVWYAVETDDGTGWVKQANVEPVGEMTGGLRPEFEVGQTVYLQGVQYLIGIMDAPGSTTMAAAQERGTAVTIEETRSVGGNIWYRIKAPTGEGWVSESNLTAEEPGS
ncbi:MAG: GW dipeptide domain-containing protein [Anaerolineales bacterium]